MPQIQCLPPHVADLIAAGEVVERPASVMKELLENAIDAGASAIVAEIERGGLTYIRITDNGCGIPAEQLPTAFLRHATSKVRAAADLSDVAYRLPGGHYHLRSLPLLQHPRPHEVHEEGQRRGHRRVRRGAASGSEPPRRVLQADP